MFPDEGSTVVVTLADAVGWAAFVVVMVAGLLFAFRAATATDKPRLWTLVSGTFFVAAVVNLFAPTWVIGGERTFFELSRWGRSPWAPSW